MTQKDQLKLMAQGFRIVRIDLFRMAIKEKRHHASDGWKIIEKDFKTKKSLAERMQELLTDPLTVED